MQPNLKEITTIKWFPANINSGDNEIIYKFKKLRIKTLHLNLDLSTLDAQ